MSTTRELPRYKCHKQVWALKIARIDLHQPTIAELQALIDRQEPLINQVGATITPEESGYGPFTVTVDYLRKHEPRVGGYYVVYDDGYQSWSPAEQFEKGYTLIT